jgi:hypothetical protein
MNGQKKVAGALTPADAIPREIAQRPLRCQTNSLNFAHTVSSHFIAMVRYKI